MNDTLFDRAVAEHKSGRPEAALVLYRQLLAAQPDHAAGHNAAGIALMQLGRPDDARAAWTKAAALGYGPAYSNLGTALQRLGRLDEAENAYRRAIALAPDNPDAHYNLGSALHELDRLDEAIACYERAMALKPAYPQAYNNLGIALRDLARLDEAIAAYRRALAIQPDHAEAHYNLGMALLEAGDLARGFAEYEWRFAAKASPPRSFPQPSWRGEPLAGRRLLVWAEQGFGETLQFARFVPLLAERGARVVLEVQPPLARLAAGLAGVDAVVARGQRLPPVDLQVSLVSLPAILGTTLDSIPARVPYLSPPAALREQWRRRLGRQQGGRPRVGLVWAGNPKQKNDRNRTMPAAFAAQLAAVDSVDWYSLQVGAASAALADPAFARVTDLSPQLSDFADTAAALACLDLVVTVDTAVAHLAGALAIPAWVMLTALPDFRYLRERTDSPWYPSMRLFRQSDRGAWGPVVGQVAAALVDLAAGT